LNTLTTNENLKEVVLQFWQQDRTGRDSLFYTIRLVNANIASYRLVLSMDGAESVQHPEREEFSFTYQKITWTWEQGGITATDDWEARV
jgi:type VI secretion system secreted protein Hcp